MTDIFAYLKFEMLVTPLNIHIISNNITKIKEGKTLLIRKSKQYSIMNTKVYSFNPFNCNLNAFCVALRIISCWNATWPHSRCCFSIYKRKPFHQNRRHKKISNKDKTHIWNTGRCHKFRLPFITSLLQYHSNPSQQFMNLYQNKVTD